MKNFGEILKRIRKQKDMTQEQLAEYLNISPQSVSKWETNLTLPDITLIPIIANIFDVSADVLLGIDIDAKEKRIQEIVKQAEEYHCNGNRVNEARETLRTGLKEYPNSYKIMSKLMRFLYYQIYDENKTGEDERLLTTEIISLGEKVLADCTDDSCRHDAIQTLCYKYPLAGESEKAVKLADAMPVGAISRERLLAMIYRGTKQFNQRRDNLFSSIGDVVLDMAIICGGNLDDGSRFYTDEECIIINQKILAFLNLMFDDGNYGFYRYGVVFAHRNIAEYYGLLGNVEKAIENLRLASEHAILYDTEESSFGDKMYTSLPFRDMRAGSSYIKEENSESKQLLERMAERSEYDIIRGTKEFEEVKKYLTGEIL